jgi:hypothetical protein
MRLTQSVFISIPGLCGLSGGRGLMVEAGDFGREPGDWCPGGYRDRVGHHHLLACLLLPSVQGPGRQGGQPGQVWPASW